MSELIERMARAIEDERECWVYRVNKGEPEPFEVVRFGEGDAMKIFGHGSHDEATEAFERLRAEGCARAALQAAREPTERMKVAGEYDDCGPPGDNHYITESDAEGVWTRMIDAELADGDSD